MHKIISTLMFTGLAALLVAFASAQEKKPVEPPNPAQNPSQELWGWNGIGKKLIAMAEDFPEDKYDFKAQKDERTFAENLLHVASDYYSMISAIKGTAMGSTGNEDSLRKKYPTKTDIVNFMKQSVADGAQRSRNKETVD